MIPHRAILFQLWLVVSVWRSGRSIFWSERADFRPEKADLMSERVDLRPERVDSGQYGLILDLGGLI